jgi:hypothetical protein
MLRHPRSKELRTAAGRKMRSAGGKVNAGGIPKRKTSGNQDGLHDLVGSVREVDNQDTITTDGDNDNTKVNKEGA